MENTITVGKWGNAYGIRLPRPFCDSLGIKAGDKVAVSLGDDRITLQRAAQDSTITARMERDWDGKPLKANEFDWGAPAGREIW